MPSHESLLIEAQDGLSGIVEAWRADQKLDPFLISWPSRPVKLDDGTWATHFVLTELPPDKTRWRKLFELSLKRTSPMALMFAEQREDEVVVIFESFKGTRSWRYPIKDHGGTKVLGGVKTRDDVDCLGLLWRKDAPEA